MHHIGFRLSDNPDPEERLEEAALWKAMHDHYGPERITPLLSGDEAPADWILFGRQKGSFQTGQEPVSDRVPYWEDPAFLRRCGRRFSVVGYEDLPEAVARIHGAGKGAFLKSTRLKHWKKVVPVGSDLDELMGDMAYSFMDGGPSLMVQELVDMTYERRFFVIGRKIVTSSPVMNALTPLDWPLPRGASYATPVSSKMEELPLLVSKQHSLAHEVAQVMRPEHAVLDVAIVAGDPVLIEMNPMVLGQAGLFAGSVRDLAAASEDLISDFVPVRRSVFAPVADEDEFRDEVEDWSDAPAP